MPENPRVWLVIPTYNESANVEAIVEAAREVLTPSRRILIVDDSSPDGTGAIADRLADAHEDVAVLHRPGKAGLGPAYVAGFRVVEVPIVFRDRRVGESKMTSGIVVEAAWRVAAMRLRGR